MKHRVVACSSIGLVLALLCAGVAFGGSNAGPPGGSVYEGYSGGVNRGSWQYSCYHANTLLNVQELQDRKGWYTQLEVYGCGVTFLRGRHAARLLQVAGYMRGKFNAFHFVASNPDSEGYLQGWYIYATWDR